MSILEITGLSHSFGDNLLFQNADLALNKGEHIGIVGRNGAGKSTLIKLCGGQLIPDAGRVAWQPGVAFGCLDQHARIDGTLTMQAFLQTAFAPLYEAEADMNRLYELAGGGDASALERAAHCQERLELGSFYTIDTQIQQVAEGLGLHAIGLERPVAEMSGGQRAKVILAKLLLQKPDVLLLDEPTNFLDKEHIAWLAGYLAKLDNAFLVVSHQNDFLEKTATHICEIENRKIAKYYGSYSVFLKKKTALREDYIRQYAAQQREIKKTEEFIRRNIAGRKTRMAQGRRKQLERMERMEAPEQTAVRPFFHFSGLPVTAAEHLTLNRLTVGYQYPVLSGLSFSIKGGQKVAVTGFNGIGKSTLLKTLVGQLPALGGSYALSPQAAIGYYEQELRWEDGEQTPLQILAGFCPGLSAKEVRQHLARCGISSKHAMQEIETLSGGEQAKVKLCLLTHRPCNFLILDEPTNHLDGPAKEALRDALLEFPGTVLLVSHEESFYRDWVQRVIRIEEMQ